MSRYNDNLIATAIRPDAKLGKLTVSRIGKYYAFTEDLDGFSSVEVKPQQLTPTERDFYCGNPYKRTQVFDETVTDIVLDVSASFPNLSVVVVGNTTQVVTGLDTMIGSLQGVTFVVPNSLQADYVIAYPNLTFTSWVFQVEFTIPYIGDSELTAEYVKLVVEHSSGDVAIVDKVIVPAEFTSFETGVFDYIFLKFPNCEEINYYDSQYAKKVEYIESTGTQYIGTGVYPNQDSILNISFGVSNAAGSSGGQYGSRNDVNNGMFGFYASTSNFNAKYGSESSSAASFSTAKHTVQISKNGVYIDSVLNASFSPQTFNSNNTFALFALNSAGTIVQPLPSRIYSCKIYADSILVRDFIPCYRLSDNGIGLYDTVNDVFYANAGTGTFLKGSDTGEYISSPATLTRPALSTCHIYHDENTSHTLTAQIVQETLTKFPEYAGCEKVIVDEWFTEYESGSINAIISAFTGMVYLNIPYLYGNLDFSFSGTSISGINGTSFDDLIPEADSKICLSKTLVLSGTDGTAIKNAADSLLFMPPIVKIPMTAFQSAAEMAMSGSDIRYSAATFYSTYATYNFTNVYKNCSKLCLVENLIQDTSIITAGAWVFQNCAKLKRVGYFDSSNINNMIYSFDGCVSLQSIEFAPITMGNLDISASTMFTRDALNVVIHNLSDRTGQATQTLTIGATNLAKLTAEDIQIATNKGWVVQ